MTWWNTCTLTLTPCKATAFLFAVAGLGCATVAARYWFRGSREYPPELAVSITDSPEQHIQNALVSIGKAARLNATAALWTGAAAILSASGSVIGLF
jgi:hypothetical protein